MFLNEAKTHLKRLLEQKTPVFLWGAPGIGKSSIVAQIAEEQSLKLIDLRLSLLNPVDLRGLPFMDTEKKMAVWLHPEFLPRTGKGILFLDEMNTAPTSVQIAAYQLLLDRKIGNYTFPEGWQIVAAGNRETDKAAVNRLPSPLANRLIHLFVEADVDDWKIWAHNRVDPRVVAFINFRPELLSKVPKEEEKAYPTPRSWSFVSNALQLYAGYGKDTLERVEPVIQGCVGEGATKEFYAFLQIYKHLPDIDAILRGENIAVPKKADVLYALSAALVAKVKEENIDNFMMYALKLPAEFSALAVRDAARSGWADNITNSKYWKKWGDKYGGIL